MNTKVSHPPSDLTRPDFAKNLTLVQAIGRFACETKFQDIPAEVIEKIRICLFFNMAIALAGYSQVREIANAVSDFPLEKGTGSRVFVDGTWLAPGDAAFANAAMVHARAQDDFQHSANVHVGAISVPALLALSDWRGYDGKKFLTGLAVAYQVATILGEENTAITTPRGFRASALYAAPAAAAACANFSGADFETATNAVSIAAHWSAGLNQAWVSGTNEWRLHIGQASRNSISALLQAEAGFQSSKTVFEGKYGFFPAHGVASPDVDKMIGKLFGPWLADTVAFKPLPVCGINQGPARNAMKVARSGAVDPARIVSYRIFLPPEDVAYPGIADTGAINSVGSALMRSSFVTAICLSTGNLRYRNLDQRDPAHVELAERGTVEIAALDPMCHRLEITLDDGSIQEFPYEYQGTEFILDRAHIKALFTEIADELALPTSRLDEIEKVIWSLDSDASPTGLVDAMTRPV